MFSKTVVKDKSVAIDFLILALGSADDRTRWNARQSLVTMGRNVVPELIKALKNPSVLVRWEVTQVLATLGDPAAAPALVEALADDDNGVRWSAVRALIVLKEQAIIPLVRGLVHPPKSNAIFDGAHHVLKNIPISEELSTRIEPVLHALEGPGRGLQVPIVARLVLFQLEKSNA
jgi:hypothetical protein